MLIGMPLSIFGLAAVKSFLAYSDEAMLGTAVQVWELVNEYVIQPTQAESGVHPKRNATIPSTCYGGKLIQYTRVYVLSHS